MLQRSIKTFLSKQTTNPLVVTSNLALETIMDDKDSVAQTRGRREKKEKKTEEPPHEQPMTSKKASRSGTKRKQNDTDMNETSQSKTRSKKGDEPAPTTTQEEADPKSEALELDAEFDNKVTSFLEVLKNKSGGFNSTSMEGKTANLKVTTWNINGIRAWLTKQNGLDFMRKDDADVFCFQEIKCGNSKLPSEIKDFPGYRIYYNGSDDGRSGVLCMSKKQPLKVTNGIGIEIYDVEARTITMEYDKYYIINVYVPNSGQGLKRLDFRMKWDADFLGYIRELNLKKPVILCGDMNVSHHEIDLANPKTNLKTAGFTIGERNNFSKFLEQTQLVDIFRLLNPGKPACYTFWSYMRNAREKNIGWRLDYFLISRLLVGKTCDVEIQNQVLGSDHCPVTIHLAI